jgi:hypothetical protein
MPATPLPTSDAWGVALGGPSPDLVDSGAALAGVVPDLAAVLPALLRAIARLLAHVGGLSDVVNAGGVPSWLTVLTGGALVGGSFLFTSLLTDHEGIRRVNALTAVLPTPAGLQRAIVAGTRALGVIGLALVLAASALGPSEPTRNFAILVVWAGWWAGFAMSTYLVGNAWPLLNPWRTIATALPGTGGAAIPASWGAWPSVLGLLGLVYLEIVSPLAEAPVLLGFVVVAYTLATLAGASRYGVEDWFDRVDPISRVFAAYGRVAPLQAAGDGGVALRLPGSALVDARTAARDRLRASGALDATSGATAFVIALLWATTFDGLVTTPAWNALARAVVGAGVPPTVLYLVALLAGFLAFRGAYRLAAVRSRKRVDSYLTPSAIEYWFVPALLPIAAAYHVAHFLGYFISLSPALTNVLAHPLGGAPVPEVAILPLWFGTVQLALVVLGHLLAVWVAHALALEVFPGLLRPIRSQYPFVVVMVAYTMTSAWVIGQPFVDPAYL